jgi:bacterial/archaeal transporter family protein
VQQPNCYSKEDDRFCATMPTPSLITSAGTTSESRNGVRKTRTLVLVVIATNVLGNVSLSHGMHQVGRIVSASPLDYLRAFANSWTLLGVFVLAIWMLSDLALLSRADLSFVLPVTASAYVLVALGGHFLLHERISWPRWTGIVLITVGVILAEETPARTTTGPPEHLL